MSGGYIPVPTLGQIEALQQGAMQMEQRIAALEAENIRLREKLGPLAEDRICLNCGASEPCHLNTAETSGDPEHWPGSPCTFDPTPQQLWDDNKRLRTELDNEKARGIHSCHANCTRDGCVNRRLREELAEQCRLNGMGSEREARLMAELETERMRLAACGVVAMSDTPESAANARNMHPNYRNASCDAVARRVDECIRLREELAAAQATIAKMREALEQCSDGFEYTRQYIGYDNLPAVAGWSWFDANQAAEEALAIPSDRSALDAMLAEARKEGMLEAAEVCEEYQGSAETCADAIRQAAERGAGQKAILKAIPDQ